MHGTLSLPCGLCVLASGLADSACNALPNNRIAIAKRIKREYLDTSIPVSERVRSAAIPALGHTFREVLLPARETERHSLADKLQAYLR